MVTMTCPDFAAEMAQAFEVYSWSCAGLLIACVFFGWCAGRFLADRPASDQEAG